MTTVIHTQTHTRSLATRSTRSTRCGDIIDAGIGWWRIQARRPAIVLTVSGEIDASNTDRFSESAHRLIAVGDPIVVDLSGVDFFGVQAFRALFSLDDDCRKAGVPWALVAGRGVRTLLRIGDCEGVLPVVSSVADALQQFQSQSRARRGLLVPLVSRAR